MGNPFYVQPVDLGQVTSGVGQAAGLAQMIRQKRQQGELDSARKQAVDILKTGDQNALQQFLAGSPYGSTIAQDFIRLGIFNQPQIGQKMQKTGAFLTRGPEGGLRVAAGVFDPSTGKLRTETAALEGELISGLGETAEEQTARKVAQRRGEKIAVSQEERAADLIDQGVEAGESLAVSKRALSLLNQVKTGGINAASLRAKQFFGVEGANEGELSNLLGKAVLSQLKATFGAQFTEREGAKLDRIEASFGKNPETNKRLIKQIIQLSERKVQRAIRAANRRGDKETVEDLKGLLEFKFETAAKPISEMTNEELIQQFEAK